MSPTYLLAVNSMNREKCKPGVPCGKQVRAKYEKRLGVAHQMRRWSWSVSGAAVGIAGGAVELGQDLGRDGKLVVSAPEVSALQFRSLGCGIAVLAAA